MKKISFILFLSILSGIGVAQELTKTISEEQFYFSIPSNWEIKEPDPKYPFHHEIKITKNSYFGQDYNLDFASPHAYALFLKKQFEREGTSCKTKDSNINGIPTVRLECSKTVNGYSFITIGEIMSLGKKVVYLNYNCFADSLPFIQSQCERVLNSVKYRYNVFKDERIDYLCPSLWKADKYNGYQYYVWANVFTEILTMNESFTMSFIENPKNKPAGDYIKTENKYISNMFKGKDLESKDFSLSDKNGKEITFVSEDGKQAGKSIIIPVNGKYFVLRYRVRKENLDYFNKTVNEILTSLKFKF